AHATPPGDAGPGPNDAFAQDQPARHTTHHVPAPARLATPCQVPGRAATTSSAGRWIGVSSPLLFTQTSTPSGASTRSTSAGKRKQLTSTTADAVPGASGSSAPSASTR